MHPLVANLSALTDDDLHKKYADLSKRISQAYRFGPHSMIPQIQMVMEDYQNEINIRNRKQMEDMIALAEKDGKGFKGIIDIQ